MVHLLEKGNLVCSTLAFQHRLTVLTQGTVAVIRGTQPAPAADCSYELILYGGACL